MEYVIVAVKLSFKIHQNSDTELFYIDLSIKLNRNLYQRQVTAVIFQHWTSSRAVRSRKNTTGQYYCKPDLEIEIYL